MANWIGVITNGGNDLLNEWVSERALRFDSAAAGSGTVAVAGMMAQTALADQKQEASIIGADKVDGGVRLKLRISAHETGYTLNQYGVWASLTGGDSILIALFQHEQGIQIPSKSESPDFVYTFYALIGCSNTGTWTVNIDTSAVVSGAEMDRAIAEATNGMQTKITASGLLKGDGKGNVTQAVAGTDYAAAKHASQHASGGSDPITPASIGAAPAGYGLGEVTPTLISNCNITKNGWYRVDASTADIPDVGLTNGVLRIDEANGDLIRQSLYFYVPGKVHKMERVHFNGTWYPWEWVNPPMTSGIEYRTTERYKEKAVYKKLDTDGVIKWRVDGETTWHSDKPISKSVTLSASGWDSSAKTQTVTVPGVLADETAQLITPTPALASQAAYYDAVILCTGQAANKLTFTAKRVPTANLTVYVTIQEVGA